MLEYLQNQSPLNIHDARKWQKIIGKTGRLDSSFCIPLIRMTMTYLSNG
jgi:hypothetical protein